jgi:formate-dependent nitrite reductase cytochrome c552 subunit
VQSNPPRKGEDELMEGSYRRRAFIISGFLFAASIGGLWLARAVPVGLEDGPKAPEIRQPTTDDPVVAAKRYPVKILEATTPRVLTGKMLHDGTPETVACATCHATKTPNPALSNSGELGEFHQGLTYRHGELSCLSCHKADDYDSLRLANNQAVAFRDVMTLCSQCHGPQYRDYEHGSHGGMTGYWDLTAGPRERNNCITCHDPHAPAYPKVLPVFKPNDTKARSHMRKPAPDSPTNAHD